MFSNFKTNFRNCIALIYGYSISEFVRLLGLLLRTQSKILCISYYGKGFGCNPKYIAKELLDLDDTVKIYWAIKDGFCENQNENIKLIKYKSPMFYYHLATSKIWISNIRLPWYFAKKKDQFYIQTWHGAISLKRIEKDAESALTVNYLKHAKYDSKVANLFISNSKFNTDLYQNSFWYNGEILESGCPRNDILINNDKDVYEKVKYDKLKIDKNKKILLYAPTFRHNHSISVYDLDFKSCIKALESKYDSEFVLLLRLHPNVSYLSKDFTKDFSGIDVTSYDDMQELLLVSDVLITDYSSSMFDFSITTKPVFIYASDVEEYKSDRDFYFELERLPFPLATTNEKLLVNILEFDFDSYKSKLEKFHSQIGLNETGKASSIVAKRIIREIGSV